MLIMLATLDTCDPVQVIAAGWESVLTATEGHSSLKTVGTKEIFPKQISEQRDGRDCVQLMTASPSTAITVPGMG